MSPRPSWKKTLYAVWVAEFLAISGFGTSVPIMPFFIQDLGVHDPARISYLTGLLTAIPALMLALFAPIWGNLADKVGRKPMLLRAMLGGAVLLLLQGLSTNPWQFLVLRALQGCVTGTVAAATLLVASNSPREEAGASLGLLQMAIFLGNSAGPMFGGFISDRFGHRVNFFATSILLLSAGLIVLRFVKDDFRRPQTKARSIRGLIPDFSPLRKSKALWALLAVVAADQIAGSIASPFIPLYIQSMMPDKSAVGSMTGLILGLGALSSALAAFLLGKLSWRIGYRRTLVICMTAAAAFALPQAFVTSPLQLLVLRLFSAFFIGGNMPSVNALIAERAEAGKQGSVYGLSSSVSSGSNALGPTIGAAIVASSGHFGSVFFGTSAILATAGASIAFFLRRGRSTAAAATPPAAAITTKD
jgi:DHA1 family multidrug resistance protein-like MFS transporter